MLHPDATPAALSLPPAPVLVRLHGPTVLEALHTALGALAAKADQPARAR